MERQDCETLLHSDARTLSWIASKMTCEEGEFNFKLKGKVPYYLSNLFHGNLRDVLMVSCIDGLKLKLPKLPLVALSPLMRDELRHRDEEDHVITTERESSDILQVLYTVYTLIIKGAEWAVYQSTIGCAHYNGLTAICERNTN